MVQFGDDLVWPPAADPARAGVLTPRLSYWLNLVTAVPTNVARAVIAGFEHDVLAHDTASGEAVSSGAVDALWREVGSIGARRLLLLSRCAVAGAWLPR